HARNLNGIGGNAHGLCFYENFRTTQQGLFQHGFFEASRRVLVLRNRVLRIRVLRVGILGPRVLVGEAQVKRGYGVQHDVSGETVAPVKADGVGLLRLNRLPVVGGGVGDVKLRIFASGSRGAASSHGDGVII